MKILVLSDHISLDVKSGSSDVSYGIALSLSQLVNVDLITFMPNKIRKESIEKIGNLTIYRISEKKIRFLKIKDLDYDVVIINSPRMFVNYILSKKIKKPIFYVEHSSIYIERFVNILKKDPKYYFFKLIEKFIHVKSDAILFGSEYMRSMANLSNKEIQKSFIIPFGLNKPLSFELTKREEIEIYDKIRNEIDDGFKIISSVRGLKPRTGVDNLIKAFKYLKGKKVKLYIGGSGPLYDDLNKLIKDLDLDNSVHLLGKISDEMKFKLFSASYFSVMPTVALEGFGISILESMYVGCPVVVTPIGGMYEFYVKNSLEELITDTIESESIAKKISQLLEEPDKMEKLRTRSTELAKNRTYENLSSTYLKEFSYILEICDSKKGKI
ncbi:MAG: glycosyltransferase family 4 protein [Thermoplasmata archaeon]